MPITQVTIREWRHLPHELKSRFPQPPARDTFANDIEHEEAVHRWQDEFGNEVELALKQYKKDVLYSRQCARMLVPKFACEDENGFHVQWPKDDPKVVYAQTKEELVDVLAKRLMELGRVGNEGPHLPPENGCPTC